MKHNPGYFWKLTDFSGAELLMLFHDGEILHQRENFLWSISDLSELEITGCQTLLLLESESCPYLALTLTDQQFLKLDVHKISLRQMLLDSSIENFSNAGKATQLLNWYNTHQYCGRCGAATVAHERERALTCGNCTLSFYPRINPCVIVLVVKENKVLLARHFGKASAFYSCLAGFMEVGETPEDTVVREVREEVGIEVENIRYIKSQSWPFPSQLMLGFFADYKSGEILVDGKEIAEANWFNVDALPITPAASISVAGQLIELFLQRFDMQNQLNK